MKLTKDFWYDPVQGAEVFEMRATVEGKEYGCRQMREPRNGNLPLDALMRYMRRQLMDAIEKDLFQGVR